MRRRPAEVPMPNRWIELELVSVVRAGMPLCFLLNEASFSRRASLESGRAREVTSALGQRVAKSRREALLNGATP